MTGWDFIGARHLKGPGASSVDRGTPKAALAAQGPASMGDRPGPEGALQRGFRREGFHPEAGGSVRSVGVEPELRGGK